MGFSGTVKSLVKEDLLSLRLCRLESRLRYSTELSFGSIPAAVG
jgi:hypothetical protein